MTLASPSPWQPWSGFLSLDLRVLDISFSLLTQRMCIEYLLHIRHYSRYLGFVSQQNRSKSTSSGAYILLKNETVNTNHAVLEGRSAVGKAHTGPKGLRTWGWPGWTSLRRWGRAFQERGPSSTCGKSAPRGERERTAGWLLVPAFLTGSNRGGTFLLRVLMSRILTTMSVSTGLLAF